MKKHDRAVRERRFSNTRTRRPQTRRGRMRPGQGRTALRRESRVGGATRCGIALVCMAAALAGCSSGQPAAVQQPPATVWQKLSGTGPPPGVGDWVRPPLAGMYASHPEMGFTAEEWHGIVSIEPPCVYFTFDSDYLLPDGQRDRVALSLPYPETRFEESTQTLWSGDVPIRHGDRVLTGGNEGSFTIGGKARHELHLFWDVCAAHGRATTYGLESLEWYCARDLSNVGWTPAVHHQRRLCVEDTRPWNQRE